MLRRRRFFPAGDLKLDLGCGYSKPPGFIGIDNGSGRASQVPSDNAPDIDLDIFHKALPFPDDSCSEVWATHFIEHVPADRFAHVLDEVHRVLRPGGTFFVVVPYGMSSDGLLPGHEMFLTERFFDESPYYQDRFVTVKAAWDTGPEWDELPAVWRDELGFSLARRVLFNVCRQMSLWATPRKGDWATAERRTCEQAFSLSASEDDRDADPRPVPAPR